jgi:hypothetical protein
MAAVATAAAAKVAQQAQEPAGDGEEAAVDLVTCLEYAALAADERVEVRVAAAAGRAGTLSSCSRLYIARRAAPPDFEWCIAQTPVRCRCARPCSSRSTSFAPPRSRASASTAAR